MYVHACTVRVVCVCVCMSVCCVVAKVFIPTYMYSPLCKGPVCTKAWHFNCNFFREKCIRSMLL